MNTKKNKQKKIVTCFLGEVDIAVVLDIHTSLKSKYQVCQVVVNKQHTDVMSTPKLLTSINELSKEDIEENNIVELLIIPRNNEEIDLFSKIRVLLKLGVKLCITPCIEEWSKVKFDVNRIKNIDIEDLLIRDSVSMRNESLSHDFEDKIVLITGAAGSIGSELSRQISKCNCKKIVLFDHSESMLYELEQYFLRMGFHQFEVVLGDIRNKQSLLDVFSLYQPNVVFHAAAYKHVPLMEKHPREAFEVNVIGTKILADLSVKFNAEKFIFISTDKAINPISVMGKTKKIAETYLLSLNDSNKGSCKFIVTRFGNVLSSSGSVLPLFKKQIKYGGPITLTDKDVTRYFMSIQEACELVLQSGKIGVGGEVFSFDMGKSIKIYDIAKTMIELERLQSDNKKDIRIIGLRPGEKLHEESVLENGVFESTKHDKIKRSKPDVVKKCNIEVELMNLLKSKSLLELKEQINHFIKKHD